MHHLITTLRCFSSGYCLGLLLLLGGLFGGLWALVQDPEPAGGNRRQPSTPSVGKEFDARHWVESLASTNLPPELVPGSGRPNFAENFAWSEQRRVWSVMYQLIEHAEAAWPVLAEHLGDVRYSLTVDHLMFDSPYNWSIGDICFEIMGRNLSQGYYQELKEETRDSYIWLRTPHLGFKADLYLNWHNKQLDELQIEACEWALQELTNAEQFRLTSAETKQSWKLSILAAKQKLSATKRAVRFRQFGPEEIVPYSKPPDPAPASASGENDPFG